MRTSSSTRMNKIFSDESWADYLWHEKHRLVYRVSGGHGENLEIVSCRNHYTDH